MNATTIAAWASAALVLSAVVPTAWVLGREARRRRAARVVLAEVLAARTMTAGAVDVDVLAADLKKRFDALTLDRTVEELLRSTDEAARSVGAKLFVRLGLVDRYGKVLREAKRWSERTHAAEVLGMAGASQAVPALVAAMNDRFEDASTVKAAATKALARLRDETAIPLLVDELVVLDEGSARSVAEALVAFGTLTVAPLLELLAKPGNPTARVWAARILGRIGDARATDDLVTRLHDRDDLLRMAAAEALGLVKDARAVQPLIRATLRDPAPQVRAHAAAAVAAIEGSRAIDVLVAALADPDYATRLRALEAFEAIRVEDTSHLESALRDPNLEVRRRAALALERVGYLDRKVRELTSDDARTSERAYGAVAELGAVGLMDSVVAYVHHESFEVRALVARICGELTATRIAPLLRARLDDDAWPVRAAIAEALGRLKADETVPALVPLLVDPEEPVREAAAEALASFPPKELGAHMAALAAAYDQGSVAVRKQMVLLVGRLEDASGDALLVRASTDASDTVRLRAVSALGDRRGDVMVEPLVARLTDASLEVRMAAVAALGSAATTEAFEGLLSALLGAAPDVRERISDSLARGARAQLFARLAEIEKSSSVDVRLGVAWTLGKCRDVAGVPTLARFLRDPNAVLRASAAGALAKIADPSARSALLEAADDPNGRVRAAVVNALGRAPSPEAGIVAALERRVHDPDLFVRDRALVSLACLSGAELAPRLATMGKDVGLPARVVAAALVGGDDALGTVLDELARDGTLEAVLRFLAHEDASVRARFFGAVHLEDPSAGAPLAEDVGGLVGQYEGVLRTNLDATARRFAVRALARLRGGRSSDVLADALSYDPSEEVRVQAASALAPRVDDPVARAALAKGVGDPSTEVASSCVRALARREEPEIAVALAKRLGAGAPEVQALVETTLADVHRGDPWPFLDRIMGADVPELLVPAVRVLERMAHPDTLPLLAELAKSEAAVVRAATVRALGALPVREAADVVDGMAQDPSEEVRLAVLETIIWSGDSLLRANPLRRDPSVRVRVALATSLDRFEGAATKSALSLVVALASDASSLVRASALVTMMASRDEAGLRAFAKAWAEASLDTRFDVRTEPRGPRVEAGLLLRLASETDAEARRAAVTAIGALGAPGFATRLLPSLRDPSPEVRVAVVQALAGMDEPEVRTRLAEMLSDPDTSVREVARRSMLRSVT